MPEVDTTIGGDDIRPRVTFPSRPAPQAVTERIAENQNTPFTLGIYQNALLTDLHGRIPEEMLTQQILGSFRENGRDIEIRRDFPVVGIEGGSGCGSGALDEFGDFLQTSAPYVAEDSNILLMDTNGGGCGFVGGNACTAPALNIDERRSRQLTGSGDWSRNVSACMHEVGHNMGWGHCSPIHPGWGENRSGEWHRTPSMSCNDTENACGEFMELREFTPDVSHLYYYGCAFDTMEIVDKPLLEPDPDEPDDPAGAGFGTGSKVVAGFVALGFAGAVLRRALR